MDGCVGKFLFNFLKLIQLMHKIKFYLKIFSNFLMFNIKKRVKKIKIKNLIKIKIKSFIFYYSI